ncbi:TVP38/TMEM64 family protein [Kaarinaea lacus]
MDTIKLHHDETKKHYGYNTFFYGIAVLLIVAYMICEPEMMSLNQAKNLGSGYESVAAMYLFSFLVMLLCALTPLPAELIALTNTFMYSPAEAFLVTWTSALFSAQIGYEFGRLNTIEPCRYRDSNRICRWLNCYGYQALVVMRLVPVIPFFALNICSGIFKLSRTHYTAITAVTIIPAIAILSFFPHFFSQY